MTLISYSLTGNNDALAARIAADLSAHHVRITEAKSRTYFTIGLDLIFGRTPKITLSEKNLDADGFIVFVAPVWMGRVAFPLRACLRDLKENLDSYAFVSISGGGDGPDSNPNLTHELEKRTGKKPLTVINLHIADFIASGQKPTPQEIENYRLQEKDVERLTEKVVSALQEYTAKPPLQC